MTRAFAVEMKRWPKNKLLVEVQGQSLRGEKKKKKKFLLEDLNLYMSVSHVPPVLCTCSGIPDQVIKGKATVGL